MVAISLSVIGVFVIYALKPELLGGYLIAVLMGVGVMVGLGLTPFPWLISVAPLIGGMSLMLLVLTLLSPSVRGARRWIWLGPIHFQPSEFVKLAMVLMAWWLVIRYPVEKLRTIKSWLIIGSVVSGVIGVIGLEPDLGTAVFIGLSISLASLPLWISWKRLLVLIAVGLIILPIGWYQLKPYQKQRVVAFIDPLSDPRGSGYNIIRALLTIKNGGLWGKAGQRDLYQSRLPEAHTDFIFAVWVEDAGLIGGLVMLGLYGLFLIGVLRVRKYVFKFEESVLMLISSFIVLQAIIHVGINLGILPVTGLPLPFVSYGRSSMLVSYALVGLLISRLQKNYWFKHNKYNDKKVKLEDKGQESLVKELVV